MARTAATGNDYRPISDYGIIGDTRGLALVNSEGGIDWCALPHIDSPPFFLKILDTDKGGAFGIKPTGRFSSDRRYIDDSNVLRTRFSTAKGTVELTDCFSVPSHKDRDEEPAHEILRLVECTRGTVEIQLDCRVTPDYARQDAPVKLIDAGTARWTYEGGEVWLTGNWPIEIDGEDRITCRCKMETGDRFYAILSDSRPDKPVSGEVRYRINQAVNFWRQWVHECPYFGMYRNMVIRSALTLKLLTFRPTGAIVAAATTSLPEEIGGERNWDYRYTWIRDATLTLWSFGLIGFYDEADDFMHWIQDRCFDRDGGRLQIMYGIRGEKDLTEQTLDHLSGYRDSRPVRIGNGAYDQRQLDIYGEIFDTAYLFYYVWERLERYSHHEETLEGPMWKNLRELADEVCDVWMEKDQGIWEVRGGPQHFVHSKVMCWVALQRAVRLARHFDLPGDIERWSKIRDEIKATTLERGYNEELGCFTQAYDSTALDASALLLPMVHFVKGDDPRMAGTVDAIQNQLTEDGLVYRYLIEETDDGLSGDEGTFTICSFWLVDNLSFLGRIDEARDLFAKLINFSNDLGLYSEEIDPRTGEFLGNFPQAFTHMALINAAVNLDKADREIQEGKDGRVRVGVRRSAD
ncbi:glycoside hydrolase family 15 protein [soil metagenome]